MILIYLSDTYGIHFSADRFGDVEYVRFLWKSRGINIATESLVSQFYMLLRDLCDKIMPVLYVDVDLI